MGRSLEDQQMGNHEISFNTNLSEPPGRRADFTETVANSEIGDRSKNLV